MVMDWHSPSPPSPLRGMHGSLTAPFCKRDMPVPVTLYGAVFCCSDCLAAHSPTASASSLLNRATSGPMAQDKPIIGCLRVVSHLSPRRFSLYHDRTRGLCHRQSSVKKDKRRSAGSICTILHEGITDLINLLAPNSESERARI
jgi:hypothetical protein